MASKLKLYSYVQKMPWPHTFWGRVLFITFIGLHLPLIGILVYLLIFTDFADQWPLLVCALAITLISTAATLWILSGLLQPIMLSAEALEKYNAKLKMPDLPTTFSDEVGRLMTNVQANIKSVDRLLNFKNKLLPILSHDAQTPLHTIILYQGLIDENLNNDTQINAKLIREYTKNTKTSAFDQKELLDNILMLAQIDSQDIKVDFEETSLQKLIEKVYHFSELHLKSKDINFEYDNNQIDRTLIVDEKKLKSVLNNLVQNAIKFTPRGGKIKIDTEFSNQTFKIKVSDTGVGINPALENDLFNPDVQCSSEGTEHEQGRGLGLWICKTFTELNNGTISYKSKKGEGTTFILTFDAHLTVLS